MNTFASILSNNNSLEYFDVDNLRYGQSQALTTSQLQMNSYSTINLNSIIGNMKQDNSLQTSQTNVQIKEEMKSSKVNGKFSSFGAKTVTATETETNSDSAPPPRKVYTDDIPVLDCFSGPYGFDLYRPLCEEMYEASETKPSTAFFYFKDESGWTNLYAKKAPTWWNLSYWCQSQPPEDAFIRLVPVYGTSDKQQEVIQRCFEDFMSTKCSGLSRYSVIRVGHSQADYHYDKATDRLCVTIPYERPKEGCEYSQFNGKFMCFNSCLYNGGQGNKKPLYLIITLEKPLKSSNGSISSDACEVLGRQCIKFRSCACPKRDKDNSERRNIDQVSSVNLSSLVNGSGSNKKRKRGSNCEKNSKKSRNFSGRFSWTDQKSPSDFQDYMDQDCFSSSDMELNQNNTTYSFVINGEPYQFVAVPVNIPGAISVIKQMRATLTNLADFSVEEKRNLMTSDPERSRDEPSSKNSSSIEDKYSCKIAYAECQAAMLLRDYYQGTMDKRQPNISLTDSSSSIPTNLTSLIANSTPNSLKMSDNTSTDRIMNIESLHQLGESRKNYEAASFAYTGSFGENASLNYGIREANQQESTTAFPTNGRVNQTINLLCPSMNRHNQSYPVFNEENIYLGDRNEAQRNTIYANDLFSKYDSIENHCQNNLHQRSEHYIQPENILKNIPTDYRDTPRCVMKQSEGENA